MGTHRFIFFSLSSKIRVDYNLTEKQQKFLAHIDLNAIFAINSQNCSAFISVCSEVTMSFGQPCDEFPLSSLPPLIRDAVIDRKSVCRERV